MPDLFAIGDAAAVRNLYSNRTIFLVEGPGDKNAFDMIVGPGFEADLEFQIAPNATGTGSGGCRAVRDRVREERSRNPKLYGLLDGEAAAALGALDDLFGATDVLFEPTNTALQLDGCIFLAAHELENLYFGNIDVCGRLAHHAPAARLHLHSAANIKATFDGYLNRFVGGAVFKYASADLHFRALTRAIIDTKIFGTGDRAAIRARLEPAITSGGGTTWKAYMALVLEIADRMRAIIKAAGWGPVERKAWLVQLADGKQLLNKLRETHGGISDGVEGHLLRELSESTYPASFRERLFELARIEPTTSPA